MKLLSDQITPAELDVVTRYAHKVKDISGDFVEFGCYVGTTSIYIQPIALEQNKQFHVYDSFAGLPQKSAQDESPAGTDFVAGELTASKKQFVAHFKKHSLALPIIHKAWFTDLTAKDVPPSISFAFLDGDFYQSIFTSLLLTWPRLSAGGYILVHDYGRATLPGSKKAVTDFITQHPSVSIERIQEHVAVLTKR